MEDRQLSPGSGSMFDRIAPRYDLLNRVMSLGTDLLWRRRLLRALDPLRSGDELLDETSAPGEGFFPEVGQAWEAAVSGAEEVGIRVVKLRTGVVLSRGGGALSRMLLPFRLGLGGRLGSGRQFMSWIAMDDLIAAIRFAIDTPALTWRTFDWLSISLLKGMSREALRVIFCCVGLMGYLRDGPAGSLL